MARERDYNGYYLNIEGYYDKVHRTTWARHTAGILAGGTLGAAYGAVVGLIASFIPYIMGALHVPGAEAAFAAGLPSASSIGSSVALFSAVTAGVGIVFNGEVATTAASSAVGMEEKERRERLEELQHKSAGVVCSECETESAIVRDDLKQENMGKKGPPMFSWRVAAVTSPLLAAFGALISLNPHTAATMFHHADGFSGLATAAGGATAASVVGSSAVFGMFGACFGMKSSLLTNRLTNFYYDVLSERIFGNVPQQEIMQTPVKQVALANEAALPVEVAMEEPARARSFAGEQVKFSLQSILDKEDPGKSEPMVRH